MARWISRPAVQFLRAPGLFVYGHGVLSWLDAVSRAEDADQILTRMDYTLRLSGFFATLVTSCALATLHFSPAGFNETAGGIIGQIVGLRLEAVS